MIELDPANANAAEFYDQHYAGSDPIFLKPGMKLTLGSAAQPRHCRFCGMDEPSVTFKDEAPPSCVPPTQPAPPPWSAPAPRPGAGGP